MSIKPKITAVIELLPVNKGGRQHPFNEGYCPHLVVDGDSELLAVRVVNHEGLIHPGETINLEFELIYWPNLSYEQLSQGAIFKIIEGPKTVGKGKVIKR